MHRSKNSTRFPDTRWSLLSLTVSADEGSRSKAIQQLLADYTPGLVDFLQGSRGLSADSATEIVHEFIAAKILASKLLHHARPERGKFRNLVMKSLSNFASTWLRKQKPEWLENRGVDLSDIAGACQSDDASRFDHAWMEQVVNETLALMSSECAKDERSMMWEMFEARIVKPMIQGEDPEDYGLLVRRLRLESPRQAINLLATAKRAFMRHLRTVVGRYVEGEKQIEEEIRDLQEVVGR